jgi:predicted nucleotidyltransferase
MAYVPGGRPEGAHQRAEQGVALLKAAGANEGYVLGSVAEERAREDSDIDLAVAGLPSELNYSIPTVDL